MSHFKFKKRPAKGTERSKLIHKADTYFSECIRLRDADHRGIVACITCGDEHHWTDIDCGHYVHRANMATRYELENSNGQCRLCNSAPDDKFTEHGEAIDKKYGPGTAERLRKLGNTERHFMEHELQGMIEELKKEIKALKAEKFNL